VGSIVGWDKGAEWFKGAARMERGSVFYHPEKLKQKTPCMQKRAKKGKVCLFVWNIGIARKERMGC
jgi:hypothetical protein